MSEDAVNFWKVPTDDSDFWDAYVSTRPVYSQAFYDLIFDYHARHSSTWDVAHDIGCGAGQLTAKLVPRFHHVVGSDCNDTHLAVAKRNLAKQTTRDHTGDKANGDANAHLSWTHAKGEDMHQHHPAESADLLVVAEVFPIMDEAQALYSFHTLLRPGGTLAITFYGCPTIAEPEYVASCQPLLDNIMEYHWTKALAPDGTIPTGLLSVLSQAANGMASWLDYISFSPSQWTDIIRTKWNPHAQLAFFGEKTTGIPAKHVSNIDPDLEKVVEVTDPTWWANEWTIMDLKRYFRVLFPTFEEVIGSGDEYLRGMFGELERAMGGEEKVRKFTWPVVLVLATKK